LLETPSISSSDNTQLTTQVLTESVLLEHVTVRSSYPDDPYDNVTPRAILSREYSIMNVDLDSTSDDIFFSPHILLLATPTIPKYLENFRLFRAGMRVRFEFLTTPMLYGTIGISYLPYTLNTDERWTTTEQQVQSNMILVDLATQPSIVLELPYLRPQLFHSVHDVEDQQSWRVAVTVFDISTLSSGTTASVSMNVFAAYVDPEAASYAPTGQFQSYWRTAGPAMRRGILRTGQGIAAGIGIATAGEKAYGYLEKANDMVEALSDIVDEPTDNVKMDLLGDVSQISTLRSNTCAALGDTRFKRSPELITDNDIFGVPQICSIFSLMGEYSMYTSTPIQFELNPFLAGSYAAYMSRCFKFFRGSQHIAFRFVASPLVAARVQITLFTAGDASVDPSAGDVNTWIVTIKGTTDWSLVVPYLQRTAWCHTDLTEFVAPIVSVKLIDPLPQPYDTIVSLGLLAFHSLTDDIQFAGLESAVPGEFQCLRQIFSTPETMGATYPHPYQGQQFDVLKMLRRFSERQGEVSEFTAFPLEIESWEDLYIRDNFDYLTNLYMFYTGDTHMKVLFSEAQTDGTIAVAYRNSKESAIGQGFKPSNSIVVSHQSVWPMVEFEWQYLSCYPFDSPFYPLGNYSPDIAAEATISKYYISPATNFRLSYLMPVPDYFFDAEPAEFQSTLPIFADGQVLINNAAPFFSFPLRSALPINPANAAISYDLSYSVSLVGASAALGGYCEISPYDVTSGSSGAPSLTGGRYASSSFISSSITPVTQILQGTFAAYGSATDLFFNIVPYAVPAIADVYLFSWSLSLSFLSVSKPIYMPVVQVGQYDAPWVCEIENTVDVNIVDQQFSLDVLVQNTSAAPVQSAIVDSIILDVNMVGVDAPFVRVQGVVSPDVPVWVTNYRPNS
jgi:hypothetical protein